MRLSVLDQSTVVTGRSADQSIRESLLLARHTEALGYHRYWVAEHHNSASIAGSAPEILISAIAATTTRIRVGSAGVMLPHYSALKVAEQFRVLEAIAPGRIDLGLGRAPGSDGLTAHALNPNAAQAAEHFPAAVRDLIAWLNGERLVEKHPFRDVLAMPTGPTTPEIWVLGSSDFGAQVAAHFGLPYCFAHFITDGAGCAEAIETYRTLFRPSPTLAAPYAAICVWALAADTEAAAERLFSSRALARLWRDKGIFAPLPSPEEAAAYDYSPTDLSRLARIRERAFWGTPATVGERIRALARELGVDEVAVLSTCYDAAARRRSYTVLAGEFGLSGVALAAE
ncbi:MAG: LLM class flavin-dependent oxidoreductase [Alphaproteobacteria bacterium]|nr:LLM class flavin-dependent oxidoreductase [Alphaproteobacteria bacterium]